MNRGRRVRLVVLDGDGELRGRTDVRPVATPWWQDVDALRAAFPELLTPPPVRAGRFEVEADRVPAVLRLLTASPDETGHMGGDATYLIRLGVGQEPPSGLLTNDPIGPAGTDAAADPDELGAHLTPEPLRLPWAEPDGPAADLAWVGANVEVTGPPSQNRTWNLSAIWSLPTATGKVWLKCLPPFFRHEPGVLGLLADRLPAGSVPEVVASQGHRLLMADMPGEDGFEADTGEQTAMVEALVDIQLAAAEMIDDLLAAGVPDGRSAHLMAELTDLIDTLAPGSRPLRTLVDELPDRLAVVDATGLPDTLVHGDPHGGNARRGATPPMWFDWGDSFIGNPLLDLGVTHRMDATASDRWMSRWSEQCGTDLRPAWDALQPIAALRNAVVYQRFLDNIEPDERVYHRDDVPDVLGRVEAMMASGQE